MIDSQQTFTPADPLALQEEAPETRKADPEPATAPVLSPSAISTGFLPNPFSSFVPSKASPTFPSRYRRTAGATSSTPISSAAEAARATPLSSRIDVLPWLTRATLDVMGQAGFGYHFNSLETAAERREDESELAHAFGIIFSTARKFRVMTILQVWFPVLKHFVSVCVHCVLAVRRGGES